MTARLCHSGMSNECWYVLFAFVNAFISSFEALHSTIMHATMKLHLTADGDTEHS